MIRFTQGNLLDASAEALVNTVNEVGVMGKGIALMFRERFPENTRLYVEASKAKHVNVGRMFVTETGELFPRWIINFPTKKHWRHPSKLHWVRDGLGDLVRVIRELGVGSIALPPLGCGNGGLSWSQVRPLIESAIAEIPEVDVLVFEPTNAYHNTPKPTGHQTLTPARALIAELVRRYSILGLDCTILEVQKLAYFLQMTIARSGVADDPLGLQFAAHKFGPYSDRLRHLLDGIDGSLLHAEKRLSDATALDLIWFEDTKREELRQYLQGEVEPSYVAALNSAESLIDGFESPLGLELLATVDWILSQEHTEATVSAVRARLADWPAGKQAASRKLDLFDDRLLGLALERLAVSAS